MAYSRIVRVGDGAAKQFSVDFASGYINADEITVRVGDEKDGAGQPIYRTYRFISEGIIEVDGAPAGVGVDVVFTRSTERNKLLVNFQDGDVMDEENLDISFKQILFLVHEVLDGRFGAFNNDVDMGGFRLRRLGDPELPTDAANKKYVDGRINQNEEWMNQAKQYAANSLASANASAASQRLSTEEANRSKAEADASKTAAAASLASQNASKQSETNAKTSETNSKTNENASAAARDLAERWASNAENVVVAGGKFSSYHYSMKSAASAAAASASEGVNAGLLAEVTAARDVTIQNKVASDQNKAGTAADLVATTAAKNAAAASQSAAKTSETNSKASENASAGSAQKALASENAAKASETASAGSASASATSAGQSATSASASEASAVRSKASETASATSAGQSATSATASAGSATAAKTSETNAKTSETAAKASQTAAKTSETNSATSATASAASAVKSDKFANAEPNVEVEAGKFSAKHWAKAAEVAAGGGIQSVNGKTGSAIVLTPADVKAAPDTLVQTVADLDASVTAAGTDFDNRIKANVAAIADVNTLANGKLGKNEKAVDSDLLGGRGAAFDKTGNTIPIRSPEGRIKVSGGAAWDDAVNKDQLDEMARGEDVTYALSLKLDKSGTAANSESLGGETAAQWQAKLANAGGVKVLVQEFAASTTWTKPAGMPSGAMIEVLVWGGGGWGAGNNNYNGAGGGGACNRTEALLSSMPASVPIVVGGEGSVSSFGDIKAFGGGNGYSGGSSPHGYGGSGGGTLGGGGNGARDYAPPGGAGFSSMETGGGSGNGASAPGLYGGAAGGGTSVGRHEGGTAYYGGAGGSCNGNTSLSKYGGNGGKEYVRGEIPAGGGGKGAGGAAGLVRIRILY